MSDQIFLKNFRKSIEIGAFQEERQIVQDIVVNIVVTLQDQAFPDDSEVDEILSYDVLVDAVENNLAARRYDLLESLAEDIARSLLREKQARCAEVEIQKTDRVDGVLGVKIERSQSEANSSSEQKIESFKPTLFVIYDLDQFQTPKEDHFVLLPMKRFDAVNAPIAQRVLALQIDQMAWELSQKVDLPVIDTQTETMSLLTRQKNFIRALGKQVFAAQPQLEVFSEKSVIEWVRSAVHASEVKIVKN